MKLILFLSRLLNPAEIRYWSIELEIADIVWVLRKVRHLMEASTSVTMIYIDHDVALRIAKQTSLITTFTNKLNLRLVRVSDYLQRFNLNIRHKSKKQHIVFDVFSRLAFVNTAAKFFANENELNVLFTASLVKMNEAFRKRVIDDYKSDLNWQKIEAILDIEDGVKLSFFRKNSLIFRTDGFITDSYAYEPRKLCISHSVVANILKMIHDEDHEGFARYYEKISTSYYIRSLIKYFREYLKHCSECQVFQIRRHLSYEFMQFILTSSILFHIIIINFILALSLTTDNYNCLMSITCKYFKRILLIFDNIKWFAEQWDKALLHRLNIADWKLSKVIIFDKDRKFLSELWIVIFKRLDVSLLYFTVYHS